MKTIFRSLALIVISIFTVVNIQAQTRSVGLNAMQFLNVGVGARAAAMGLSTTALSNDVDQVFYNPAGSALKDETIQASIHYNSWLADITQNCLAVAYNWKNDILTTVFWVGEDLNVTTADVPRRNRV